MIPDINIKDFTYDLPESRIAKYPLPLRDSSKLLIYKNAQVSHTVFTELPSLLDDNSIMVFNNTKVVPARLFFERESGAHIEVFCLDPDSPAEYSTMFAQTESCRWHCIVGNLKRWKGDVLKLSNPAHSPEIEAMDLRATLISREDQTAVVEFSWQLGFEFSRVLEICGNIPIPPYLNRETESIDYQRYQTTYAKYNGSVAAPTAGLHFTDRVMSDIRVKGVDMETVCLHVGAGTFLPVKNDNVAEHVMHREPFAVKKTFLEDLLRGERKLTAVGTTSVRTLESLYYIGVKCIELGHPGIVSQWEPYERDYPYTTEEAIKAIVSYMDENQMDVLVSGTRIIIVPGFKFRVVDVLVTNFHQPQSTLLLLISAFVGGNWRTIYDYALENDFRFLSYGDSSILFRE